MKPILLVLAALLISCSETKLGSSVIIDHLPKDELAFQKMIIGQLSGDQEIKTLSGTSVVLPSRWSKKERSITLGYIEALFDHLDVSAYRHDYALPNSNVGIDILLEPLKGSNIYTVLPSTVQSEEYVVIGAHYDTDGKNFPGAIDNGSGMALITSVLRQACKMKDRYRNLIVVYFDQEEEGISAGSVAFARYLKEKEYNVHSAHTFDLIGWDGDKNREVQLELPTANEKVERLYLKHAGRMNIPIYSIESIASDYASFFNEGINTIGISQAFAKGDLSGKKDSPEDKYHLVDFDYLSSCTNLASAVIGDLLKNDDDEE